MVLHRNPACLFDSLSTILHATIHEKRALSARRHVIEVVRTHAICVIFVGDDNSYIYIIRRLYCMSVKLAA